MTQPLGIAPSGLVVRSVTALSSSRLLSAP